MKKNIAKKPRTQMVRSRKAKSTSGLTIGLDLGDRGSRYMILDAKGNHLRQGSLRTSKKGFNLQFGSLPASRIILEVGTHSPWVSRQLSKMGHEVIVANPRRVRLIAQSSSKDDSLDADTLARLGRVDPSLLFPITHRSETAQGDLAMIRARAQLVQSRTRLLNSVRGMAKSFGECLRQCDADQVREQMAEELPSALREAATPSATRPGFPIGSLRSALTGPVADAGRVPDEREWQAMGLPASAGLEGRHRDAQDFV